MTDVNTESQGPDLRLSLTVEESTAFLAVCGEQGREPGDVLRELISVYTESGGSVCPAPDNLDRTLCAFLDWCIDCPQPMAKARTKPRRVG